MAVLKKIFFAGMLLALSSQFLKSQCTLIGNPSSGQRINDNCAPVSKQVWYRFDFSIKPSENSYQIIYYWNDGTGDENFFPTVQWESLFPGDTTWYVLVEPIHLYPEDGNCDFVTEILLVDNGFLCEDSRQTQEVASWHTDDIAAAQGYIRIDPLEKEVCEGDSLINFPFVDASSFACNVSIPDLRKPNNQPRHVQFVYNTNPTLGIGIPDLSINVYGTIVQITDSIGDPVTNLWNVDPLTGNIIAPYSTNSGYFEGPVISSGFNPVGGNQLTFPISFPGQNTVAGDYMEVTVRNWNYCNPWNNSQTNPNAGIARTSTARIIIIDAPDPPVAPNRFICEGGNRSLNVISGVTGEIQWYSDSIKSSIIATGNSYTPTDSLPGEYSFWVSDLALFGTNCESQLTKVTLHIDPIPNKPVINPPGDVEFCYDGTSSVTLTASPEGSTVSSYIWYLDGSIIAGETSSSVTLSESNESGTYTVRTIGPANTFCESPLSDPVTVTIYPPATTTNPANTATCDADNLTSGHASFTVSTGGAPHTIQWQRSNNTGTSWIDITATNTPSDGCDYGGFSTDSLSIASADYPMNAYLYRAVVTTIAGSCTATSSPAALTVHPIPVIDTPPVSDTVCEGENAYFGVVASIATGSIASYQWQRNNADITAGLDGGIYEDFNTENLTVNTATPDLDGYQYRVVLTSDQGCPRHSNNVNLSVNPLADISNQPADSEICAGQNTSYTVLTDGDPAITNYQWEVSTDGGISWANATGGIYSNANTATLSLSNVPLSQNSNLYRCILTTHGNCDILSDEALLTVNPNPTASITPASPGSLCNGEIISFDGNAAGGTPGYTHLWTGDIDPLDDPVSEATFFTAPVLVSLTNYDLVYTVTDSKGCTASDNVAVTVNPAVTVNVTSSSTEVCAGQTVNLNGNPAGGTPSFLHEWTGSGSGELNATGIANPVFTAPLVLVQTTYILNYTATDSEGCENSGSITILVNPLPVAGISPANPGPLCFDESLVLDGNASGGTAPYFHSWSGDVDPLNATNIESPEFTAPSLLIETDYALTYTLEDSKGCIDSDTVTVTAYPEFESAVLTGSTSICAGFSADLTVTITGGVAPYTVVLNNGFSNFTINNYYSGDDINTGPLGVTTTYTLVSVHDSNTCGATTLSGTATIIVGSVPVNAELMGGREICFGETTPLRVNITGGAPPYVISIDSIGILNNYNSGEDISTGMKDVGTYAYNLLSVEDACGIEISGVDVAYGNPQQIVVNGLPEINGTLNNTPLICNNGTTGINLNTTVPGTVFSWDIDDGGGIIWASGKAPAAGSITDGSGTETIAQNLQHNMTHPVSVEYIISSAGPGSTACPGNTLTRTVVVEPTVQITASGQTICENGSTSIDVNTIYSGSIGLRYSWTVSAPATVTGETNGPAGGQDFDVNILQNLRNTSATPQIVMYTITGYSIDGSGNLLCTGVPINVPVVVEPAIIVTANNATICSDTSTSIDVNTLMSGSLGQRYNWTVSAPASVTGASNGPVTGHDFSTNITQSLINTSNSPRTVTYTIRGYTLDAGGNLACPGPVHNVSIIVEPSVEVTVPDKTICFNSSTSLDVNTIFTGTNGVEYSWTVAAPAAITGENNGPSTGVDFTTDINQTLQNSSTNSETAVYTITGYTTNAVGDLECPGVPLDVDVIIEPNIQLTASDTTICNNSSTNLDVNTIYSGSMGTRYSWTVTAPAGITGESDGPATGQDFGTNLSQVLRNNTSAPLVATYTITGYAMDAGGNLVCGGPSIDVDITVEPEIDVTAADRTICFNSSPNIDVSSGDSATLGMRYSWSVTAPASVTGTMDGPIGGLAFSQNIDHALQTSSLTPQTAVYTITGYTIDGGGNLVCAGTPLDVDVMVEPNILLSASDNTICHNTTVNMDVNTLYSGSQGVRYSWTVVAPDSVSGATDGPASGYTFDQDIDQVILNTSTTSQVLTYTLTAYTTDALGNLSCAGPSIDVDVTVEPNVIVSASDAALCFDESTDIHVNTIYSGSEGVEYSWTVNGPAEVLGPVDGPAAGADFVNNIVQVLQNTSNAPLNVIYTITGYTTIGGSLTCPGIPVDVNIVANPKPNLIPTNNTPVIATHDSTDIILNGDVPGTSFGWRLVNPGTTGASNGSGLGIGESIVQQLINLELAPVSVTYRIAPSANGCNGDSVDVEVLIDPQVDLILNNLKPDLCTGDNTEINMESSVTGATFSWVVVDPDGAGATDDTLVGPNTGASIQQNLVNTTSSPITVEYHVTSRGPATTYIIGPTESTTVTVYPIPAAMPDNRAPRICNGLRTNILLDSDVANTSFSWTVIDPTGGASGASASIAALAIGDSISQLLTNNGSTPITIRYIITPTGPLPTNCQGDPVTIDVIIDPTPEAIISNLAPLICSNEETSIELDATVAGSAFEFFVADPKESGATGGTGNEGEFITQSLSNVTQTPVLVSYEIIPYGPGSSACPGNPVYENVRINPLPVTSAINGIDTVCEGTSGLVFQVGLTADSWYEWNVPASIGTPTFGGSGLNSNAVIVTAGTTGATDSLWVNEINQYGCKGDTVYKPVTIIEYPLQSNVSGPAEVCAGSENVIYEVPENPGSTYQWFVPIGSGIVSDPTLHQVEVDFGLASGQIRVRETNAGGCVTIHNPLNVIVHPLPYTTLNADKLSVCKGEPVTFVASPAGAGNSYEFFVNGIPAQYGASDVYISDTLNNNDQVRVNVMTAAGCERLSNPLQIAVHDLPVVILTSSDADNIICDNTPVSFQATSATAVSYNFFSNSTSVQNGPLNFWATSQLDDGDEVYAEVMTAFGCYGISNSIVTAVNPLPVALLSGDNVICPGETSPITVNITEGTGPFKVTMDNGAGTVIFPGTPGITNQAPVVTTTYALISVEDANGCISGYMYGNLSGSATISLRDTVRIITQPRDASVCEFEDTSFTVSTSGYGLVYRWEYTDELSNPFSPVTGSLAGHSNFDQPTLNIFTADPVFDGYFYRVLVSSTFCPEFSYSDTLRLHIKYNPISISNPISQEVCEGDATGFGVDPGNTESPFYRWQISYDDGASFLNLSDTAIYSGSQTDSLRIAYTSPRFDGYLYRVVISGVCGVPAYSDPATLTILRRPQIISQPENTTSCEFIDARFEINATGDNLVYSWEVDMNDSNGFRPLSDTSGVYSGSGSERLGVISPGYRLNNYRYRVVVEGSCIPSRTSLPALLQIDRGPEIINQPVHDTICEFGNASFEIFAQGKGLTYIWQENRGSAWQELADTGNYIGSRSAMLSIFNVPRSHSGYRYRVLISGDCPSPLLSQEAELNVRTSPVIILHPKDTSVCQDIPVEFSIAAEGSVLTYQWQASSGGTFSNLINDGTYQGVNTSVLNISSAPLSLTNYRYRAVVSGACTPPANSDAAILIVNPNPVISGNPSPFEICEGGNVSFIAAAQGSNLVYQWEIFDESQWIPLTEDGIHSGIITSTLTIANAPESLDGNRYRLAVSSACLPVYSSEAILRVNPNPTPNITGDGRFPFVCGGFDLRLYGNPTGGSDSYSSHSWTGDNAFLRNTTTEHTVFNSLFNNSYNLTYTVTDSKGCKGSDIVTIQNEIPNAQFTSDAYPACSDLEVIFTNNSSGASAYEWLFDDGSPVETSQNAVHIFTNTDPSGLVKYFNVKLVAESPNECRDTANQFITIYPVVDPDFNVTPDTACQPVVASMLSQPGASAYEWNFGDGQLRSGSYTIMHEYTNTTTDVKTYNITLRTTSFFGCIGTATEQITVYPMPTPNFSVNPIVQTFPDATVEITNIVREGPWNYFYNFGDGNHSTEENPVHTFAEAGTYTIIQKVSAGECTDSIGQTVVINPAPPIAGFVLPESGCSPLQVQFENTSKYANSYIWDFGDGSISTKKSPIYTYFEAGVYAVTLTVSGPGGSDTYKADIEVWPTPNLFFNNAPDSVYVYDKPVKFFNYSDDARYYSWNFGDYNMETGEESSTNSSTDFEPFHVYEFEGWKDVLLIGWNEHCRDTLLKIHAVYVSPAGSFIFPNVFRPNLNGPTGGDYNNLPASEVNTVFFPGVINQVLEYHLYIYNRWGELVFESDKVNIGWDGYVNGTLARQGVYVWKVKGKYTNGKIFVEVGDVTLLH